VIVLYSVSTGLAYKEVKTISEAWKLLTTVPGLFYYQ